MIHTNQPPEFCIRLKCTAEYTNIANVLNYFFLSSKVYLCVITGAYDLSRIFQEIFVSRCGNRHHGARVSMILLNANGKGIVSQWEPTPTGLEEWMQAYD